MTIATDIQMKGIPTEEHRVTPGKKVSVKTAHYNARKGKSNVSRTRKPDPRLVFKMVRSVDVMVWMMTVTA
jgi:hypothetical protein